MCCVITNNNINLLSCRQAINTENFYESIILWCKQESTNQCTHQNNVASTLVSQSYMTPPPFACNNSASFFKRFHTDYHAQTIIGWDLSPSTGQHNSGIFYSYEYAKCVSKCHIHQYSNKRSIQQKIASDMLWNFTSR